MYKALGFMLGSLLVFGCGGSKSSVQRDAGSSFDAGHQDAPVQRDAAVACGFDANLATPTFTETDVGLDTDLDPSSYVYFDGYLNSAAVPDVFEIELLAGWGVFTDGLKTGTFPLTGDELNYESCGLCVRLLSKVDMNLWEADQYYMATGGSVTLTSVTGRITGSVSNVTFAHVDIDFDTYESTPINDGCTSQVTSVSFDGEIVAPDGGFLQHDAGTD